MTRLKNRIQALIQANKEKPKRLEILNAAGDEATVYLYAPINSWFGVDAQQFVKDFNAITAPTIHLRINSPGGDVFDGRAIATAIAQHKSNVIAHVDGLAASAASYVATAADSVEMAPGSFLMIHKAWTIGFGNSDDLLATAELLEKIDASLAADYAKTTGKTVAQIEEWMSAETWFTAEEAVENGFADSVSKEDEDEEELAARADWDLSAFEHAPKPKAAPVAKSSAIEIAVECDSQPAVAALSKIEIAAKSALAAVESVNAAVSKATAAAAEEQAKFDEADRRRRVEMLTKVA